MNKLQGMSLCDMIEQAIRNHMSHIILPMGTTYDDVYQYIRSIMRENPDIFWFSHQWTYLEDEQILSLHYTISKEKSIQAKKQIDDVVQNDFLIEKVLSLSEREQIMYVYKWLALYCKYNIYSAYNQTIYSVFVCRNSVCTGYAKAAQYLFDLLGIESKLVFGTMHNAEEGSRHCWILVKIYDQWYHLDPTLAIPETNNLLYNAGVKPVFGTDGLVYNCFCCSTESIKHSRIIEDEHELPECTSNVDFKQLQDTSIQIHRNKDLKSQGVRGCLLSDAGYFANVYLWHSNDDTQKVVKIFKKDPSHALLDHECRVMQRLSSSSSVIHFYGVTEDQNGIIIEQATPLADLLCSHYYQLSAKAFCNLLLDVLAGLQDCMNQGIYYRDIHINNIYRTPKGRYVLGDFGSCIFVEDSNPSIIGGVGSPWYLAPETYLNGKFNETSATYGIGMLAYILLNEMFPPLWKEYREGSLYYRMKGFEFQHPILLTRRSRAFEQQLASVIRKSTLFVSKNRYQKLTDLERAIKQCMTLVEYDDYLLLIGGSSERLPKFESDINIEKSVHDANTNFHSTCIVNTDILVSNGENEPTTPFKKDKNDTVQSVEVLRKKGNNMNDAETVKDAGDDASIMYRHERIDDFAATCERPIDMPTPKTYQPTRELSETFHNNSKKSIWHRIFRKKEKIDNIVYSSIFAPAEVTRATHVLIQVYLHLLQESRLVQALANEADKNAERRDYMPLQCKLTEGDKVDVLMNIYGESLLMSESKRIVWQGSFSKCSFDYLMPKEIAVDELSCLALLSVNGTPVGEMRFIIHVVEKPKQLNSEIFSKQYQKIFISYAHQDESQVEPMARAYKAQGVEYFFDRHYLKPGDIFPLKIQEFIDSADLFILCWSANAANSNYVELERQRALKRAYPKVKPFEKAPLHIYPIMIEPHADMPADMRDTYNFEVINSNNC